MYKYLSTGVVSESLYAQSQYTDRKGGKPVYLTKATTVMDDAGDAEPQMQAEVPVCDFSKATLARFREDTPDLGFTCGAGISAGAPGRRPRATDQEVEGIRDGRDDPLVCCVVRPMLILGASLRLDAVLAGSQVPKLRLRRERTPRGRGTGAGRPGRD